MKSRRSTLHFGVLVLLLTALLNVNAQQAPTAVQPRSAAPPQAQQQPQQQPQPSQEKQPVLKFAIIGDTGTGAKPQYEIGQKLTDARATFPFEFVIMLGDNLYGGESQKDFQNKFEKPYQALLSKGVKFYAALGNHDVPDRQIAYNPFNMGGKRYYSFKPKDGVRFFALDSNYMDKKQLDWLEGELKSSGSEWKICFFHHPIYSSGEKHGPSLELRKVLEPMLIKYGVDVVFAGHEHFYERIKPQNNIQYFILGNSAKLRSDSIKPNSAITAKGFDTDNAFMIAEIHGDEMTFQTISRGAKVVDSGTFKRAERKTGN
jgi:3',5'-cyclic AMP phosphodiesterase CpdA